MFTVLTRVIKKHSQYELSLHRVAEARKGRLELILRSSVCKAVNFLVHRLRRISFATWHFLDCAQALFNFIF